MWCVGLLYVQVVDIGSWFLRREFGQGRLQSRYKRLGRSSVRVVYRKATLQRGKCDPTDSVVFLIEGQTKTQNAKRVLPYKCLHFRQTCKREFMVPDRRVLCWEPLLGARDFEKWGKNSDKMPRYADHVPRPRLMFSPGAVSSFSRPSGRSPRQA
jgi:hypothetical protein